MTLPIDVDRIGGDHGQAVRCVIPDQFTSTDDEVTLLAAYVCTAIVQGGWSPEPPLGYESFRERWLASLVKTLAHIRGEAHAP